MKRCIVYGGKHYGREHTVLEFSTTSTSITVIHKPSGDVAIVHYSEVEFLPEEKPEGRAE